MAYLAIFFLDMIHTDKGTLSFTCDRALAMPAITWNGALPPFQGCKELGS